jgi:hypothetical protein
LIESDIHFHQGYALCPKNTAIKMSAAAKKLAAQIKLMEALAKTLAARPPAEKQVSTPEGKLQSREAHTGDKLFQLIIDE